jgi:hypothetical protein
MARITSSRVGNILRVIVEIRMGGSAVVRSRRTIIVVLFVATGRRSRRRKFVTVAAIRVGDATGGIRIHNITHIAVAVVVGARTRRRFGLRKITAAHGDKRGVSDRVVVKVIIADNNLIVRGVFVHWANVLNSRFYKIKL